MGLVLADGTGPAGLNRQGHGEEAVEENTWERGCSCREYREGEHLGARLSGVKIRP